MPPSPPQYFNDYAHVISPPVADQLNTQLENSERNTSNQILVVIYPKMQSDSDIADYTFRVKETWHVGQKSKNNGAVLFVFIQDRKAYIQVNYGLEGALPDATCKQIIDQAIAPAFKVGNYDGGLSAAVAGILAATNGEYKGTGQTAAEKIAGGVIGHLSCIGFAVGAFLLFGMLLLILHTTGGTFYQNHARSLGFFENGYLLFFNLLINILFSGGSSRSSWGGGSSGGGSGGGGFSGGGGTGGGGGAGGSW